MKSNRKSSSVSGKDEKNEGTSDKSPPITRGRPASQRKKFKKSLGPDFLDPLELGPTYASKRGVHQVSDLKATSSSAINVVASNTATPRKATQICSKCEIEFAVQPDVNGDIRSLDQTLCMLCDESSRGTVLSSKRQRKINNKSTPNAKSTSTTPSTVRPISAITTVASVTTAPATAPTTAVTTIVTVCEVATATATTTSASTLTSASSSSSSLSTVDSESHTISLSPSEDDSSVTNATETVENTAPSKSTTESSSEVSSQKSLAAPEQVSDMDYEDADVVETTVEQSDKIEESIDMKPTEISETENEREVNKCIVFAICPQESENDIEEEEVEADDAQLQLSVAVTEDKVTCEGDMESIEEEEREVSDKDIKTEAGDNLTASVETNNESAQVTSPEELATGEKASNGTSEVPQEIAVEEANVDNKIEMSNESTQVTTVTNVEASAVSLKSNSSSAESTSSISDEAKANYRFRSPDTWSVDEVEQFITSTGFSRESQTFKEQEIDGKSLLLLKRDDVLTGLGFKLGPALKIYSFIHHLQNFNLLTVLATPPGSVTAEGNNVDNEATSASTNVNCNNSVNCNSSSAATGEGIDITNDTADNSSQVNSDQLLDQITDECDTKSVSTCDVKQNDDSQVPSTVKDDTVTIENDTSSLPAASMHTLESNVEA